MSKEREAPLPCTKTSATPNPKGVEVNFLGPSTWRNRAMANFHTHDTVCAVTGCGTANSKDEFGGGVLWGMWLCKKHLHDARTRGDALNDTPFSSFKPAPIHPPPPPLPAHHHHHHTLPPPPPRTHTTAHKKNTQKKSVCTAFRGWSAGAGAEQERAGRVRFVMP
jgi:hypothetical protein